MTMTSTDSPVSPVQAPEIELVGPASKQRGVQLPQLLVSLLIVGVVALLVLWWNSASTARTPVLALATDVEQGQVIGASDLAVVSVSSDTQINTTPPELMAEFVGTVARSDIAAGTLATGSLFQRTATLSPDEAFIGAVLSVNQFPPGLATNDEVEVIITDSASDGVTSATVSRISESSGGKVAIRLLVAREDAEPLQRAAARNALAVFEVTS